MFCENCYCAYWDAGECLVRDELILDIRGTCCCCIYIDIEEQVLKKEREDLLSRLLEDEGHWL